MRLAAELLVGGVKSPVSPHGSLVTFSPLYPASINGTDMFFSKLPAYICHQLPMLMESPAVFLKSTTLSLAATKSVTAKNRLYVSYVISKYWVMLIVPLAVLHSEVNLIRSQHSLCP